MIKDVNKIFGEVDYNDKYLDKGIIPLIKEINKFEGIRTFSSCEGNCKNQDYCAYVILGSYDIKTMNDFFKVCSDICWRPKYKSPVKWHIDFLANPASAKLYNQDNELLVVSMKTVNKEETPQLIAELTQALHEYNSQGA